MKKTFIYQSFFLLLLLFILQACKKKPEIIPRTELPALQEVTFKLKGFTASINPLSNKEATSQRLANQKASHDISLLATKGLTPSPQEQYLYYWSFNDENTLPDMAIDAAKASISFMAYDPEASYTGGFGLSPVPAGYAFNTKGTKQITIAMPITGAEKITHLDFDASSTDTGPKDFRISYSINGGQNFVSISENNQMPENRNRYTFDLSEISPADYSENFLIKIEPFAGSRDSVGDYNEKTGTFKIDNFRLSGIYNVENGSEPSPGTAVSKLYYYVFEETADTLAASGSIALDTAASEPTLTMRLPIGNYYATFLSNISSQELLLPTSFTQAADLYIANAFDNPQALIFGNTTTHFEVTENTSPLAVELKRYFSQIKLNFTDEEDLTQIGKIIIKREHENFIYMPYGISSSLPQSTTVTITFEQPFKAIGEHTLAFNQFIGDVNGAVELIYQLQVYDKNGEKIKSLSVSEEIKNNVQLTFEGKLLQGVGKTGNFMIHYKGDWNDEVTTTF